MEDKLLPRSRSPLSMALRRKHKQGCCPNILAVLVRPAIAGGITEKLILKPSESKTDEVATKISVHNDNWFDLIAINYLSRSLQATTGMKSRKSGYDSLVEAAAMMSKKYNPDRQQELVIHVLDTAMPKIILKMEMKNKLNYPILSSERVFAASDAKQTNLEKPRLHVTFICRIKTLLPQSQFTREYFAAFTTVFFAWLIGPSEVRESELNGRREKNVVYVKRCRFLEQSSCVGMCINLCKMPSQAFIKDSLGMPVNMVPNFDDMSCEMVFGQDPPASNDDAALKQPCYKLCKAGQKHTVKCSS